jgi:hypothetical protein
MIVKFENFIQTLMFSLEKKRTNSFGYFVRETGPINALF